MIAYLIELYGAGSFITKFVCVYTVISNNIVDIDK